MTVTRPPSDRGQGRKPLPPEARAVVGSIRLTREHWAKFAQLGGIAWLRAKLEKARLMRST